MEVSVRGDGRGKMASLSVRRVELSERAGMGEVRWPPREGGEGGGVRKGGGWER